MTPNTPSNTLNIVGTSPHRLDAREKVMGRTRYTTDLTLSAMVHAKIWRSPLPHARVDEIDASAALAAPGVLAVLTAADLTNCDPYYGTAYKDQPILAGERIRYVGEPVAVVIAETERQATAALDLLDVSLSEYPAVIDTASALADDAPPILHDHIRPAGHFRDLSHVRHVANTNICHHQTFSRGDIQIGFDAADEIFEDTFSVPPIYHYAMEPHAVLARYEQDQ